MKQRKIEKIIPAISSIRIEDEQWLIWMCEYIAESRHRRPHYKILVLADIGMTKIDSMLLLDKTGRMNKASLKWLSAAVRLNNDQCLVLTDDGKKMLDYIHTNIIKMKTPTSHKRGANRKRKIGTTNRVKINHR